MSSGRRGPAGGLIGLLGTGVGAAAEYREHRKEQKQQRLSRENSQQQSDPNAAAGPSTSPQPPLDRASGPSDPPPAYGEASVQGGERSLASGGQPTDDKKAALSQYDDDHSEDEEDDGLSVEDDEEDWELDEVLEPVNVPQGLPSYEQSEVDYRTTDELVHDVMLASRAANELPRLRQPLPLPVIIPQRRPRKNARGFVRAYAPVLEDSGIDQETFLSFLKNFHKSSQASPVFTVIQVSAAIAGMVPSAIAMAVTTVVQVGATAGAEIQGRQRTNNFLDKMNEELFKPAGLYAFIMKYKPDVDLGTASSRTDIGRRFGLRGEVVDMSTNQIIAKYAMTPADENDGDGNSNMRSMSDRLTGIRLASGTTQGTVRLPEAAPLIFPDIDKAVARDGVEETFKDKAKDAKIFLADYLDRRAHIAYASQDPNSSLALPEQQRNFKSELADPNHAMYQNGLAGFVSGGAMSPRASKRERRSERRYERDERRALRYEQRLEHGRQPSRRQEARYDHFNAEQEQRGLVGRAGFRDDHGGRMGGRRRRGGGGPLGLVGSLVGAAVNAASGSGKERAQEAAYGRPSPNYAARGSARSMEYEDAYDGDHSGRLSPPYHDDSRRRSYDARDAYGRPATEQPYNNYRRDPRDRQRKARPVEAVKRMMREDVLYLMIVNMPSEAELAEAKEELARQRGK